MKKLILFAVLLFATPAFAALPQVLIIGDSISNGYTPILDANLQGVYVVGHNRGNAGNAENIWAHLEEWLRVDQGVQWAVIHVNAGLHDTSNNDPVEPERYSELLALIFERLSQTGAKVIWATTTERPPGAPNIGSEVYYNGLASVVLRNFPEVAIDDLWSISRVLLRDYHLSPGNVHFTAEGYAILAEYVEESIRRAME